MRSSPPPLRAFWNSETTFLANSSLTRTRLIDYCYPPHDPLRWYCLPSLANQEISLGDIGYLDFEGQNAQFRRLANIYSELGISTNTHSFNIKRVPQAEGVSGCDYWEEDLTCLSIEPAVGHPRGAIRWVPISAFASSLDDFPEQVLQEISSACTGSRLP